MASRPEAAYAAAEVTPRLVLILLASPPSTVANHNGPRPTGQRVTVQGNVIARGGSPRHPGGPARCPRALRRPRTARRNRNALLWPGHRRRLIRDGLGRRSRRA